MAVAEFVEHIRTDYEEFLRSHLLPYPATILLMYRLPVDTFLVKEAIMLVNYCPEGFERSLRVVGILLDLMSGGQSGDKHHQDGKSGERPAFMQQ